MVRYSIAKKKRKFSSSVCFPFILFCFSSRQCSLTHFLFILGDFICKFVGSSLCLFVCWLVDCTIAHPFMLFLLHLFPGPRLFCDVHAFLLDRLDPAKCLRLRATSCWRSDPKVLSSLHRRYGRYVCVCACVCACVCVCLCVCVFVCVCVCQQFHGCGLRTF